MPATAPKLRIEIAPKFSFLFRPARYKVAWGGRGGAKSVSIARALIAKAHTRRERIGCFREFQSSIADSVHRLLKDQIRKMGLAEYFHVTEKSIRSVITGSEFLFKGLHHNVDEIKSTEGITIAWVEEAQLVSKDSWQVLVPTIREEGSEIWASFNPVEEDDPTYQKFIVNPPPDAIVVKVGWQDNPWFPSTLDVERRYMLETDPDAYQHVWEGSCRVLSDSVIFRGKYVIEAFEAPTDPVPRFFHGLDFGFANDPNAFSRCWTTGKPPREELWIDYAVFGWKVEIDDLPKKVLDEIPTSRAWPIKADNARPETISYLSRQGFSISPAEKWPGCVEDRIAHLKGFYKIHVHERCKHLLEELRLYSYKRDRVTGEILPIIIDKHNHGIDSIGYALDGYIRRRGASAAWLGLLPQSGH